MFIFARISFLPTIRVATHSHHEVPTILRNKKEEPELNLHFQVDKNNKVKHFNNIPKIKRSVDVKRKYAKKSKKEPNYWENVDNVKIFLNELKEKLNLVTPEDWNSITHRVIHSNGGGSLFSKYSILELKSIACPEGKIFFDKPKKRSGFWNKDNIHKFLDDLKNILNIKTHKDLHLLTRKQVQKYGGSRILNHFSIFDIKNMMFNDKKMNIYIKKQTKNIWIDKVHIQNYLEDFSKKFGLKTPSDWNSVTAEKIKSNGGRGLLYHYSMYEIKCMGCPEGKSLFFQTKKPNQFWEDSLNVQNFLSEINKKLNLKNKEDWERVSLHQISSHGGSGLIKKYSKNDLIAMQFPSENENSQTIPYKRSSQRWLFIQIQKLFPEDEIIEDYFHSEISRISGVTIQFDIFIVNKNIAFEYHGKQHYEDTPEAFASIEMYKQRDNEKQKLCEKLQIQLVVVPYWWDDTLESLKETIYHTLIKQ